MSHANIAFLLLNTDNEGPIVYSPNNIPAIAVNAGMIDAAVTWSPLPSANDTVDGPIPPSTIVCEVGPGNVVISGDRFPVGTTTVTCRANDTTLNEGSSQFNITVVGRFCLSIPVLNLFVCYSFVPKAIVVSTGELIQLEHLSPNNNIPVQILMKLNQPYNFFKR